MNPSSIPSIYPRTSWFLKFSECTLAVIGIFSALLTPLEFLPASFWEKYGQYAQYIMLSIPVLALVIGIAYSIVWHRRERKTQGNSGLRHAWLQAIIRYWLAYEISAYGFAKILKTQFDTPAYRYDMPIGDMNGFQLTWFYYGYSYSLAVIIALFQIGGCVLLLFRRTTLLGVMILLPVMVNIVFINAFYKIAAGAFYNSIVFTLGLLLFLFIDFGKLKRAFWDLIERLPPIRIGRNQWFKNGLRVVPILLGFALIQSLLLKNKPEKVLSGAWKVEKLTRNGREVAITNWQTDTTAWNRVYFAGWQGCVFSPNPYRYKSSESWRGDYTFDSLKNNLQMHMYSSDADKVPDTLQATVLNRTHQAMRLHGVWLRDTIDIQLSRIR